jgi:hypothetical protein
MAVSQLGSVLYVGYTCDRNNVYVSVTPSQTIPSVTNNGGWVTTYTTLEIKMGGIGTVYSTGLQTPGTNLVVGPFSFAISHNDWNSSDKTLYWNGHQYNGLGLYTDITVATTYQYNNSVPGTPITPTFTIANDYVGYDVAKLTITSNGSNTTSYDIYRANTSGGTYSLIGGLTGSTVYYDYNVTTGNTYWYKVNGVNGCFTTWSVLHSLYIQTITDSTCVIRNIATITNKTAGDVSTTYELWRSATSGGTYQCVGHEYNAGVNIQDKITTYGDTYWYKPVQKTTYWSLTGASTQYTGTWAFSTAPVLTATLYTGSSKVTLNWTDAAIYQQYYEIYKSVDNGAFSLIATVTGSTYDAVGLTTNHKYQFKIRDKIECFAPTYIYSSYSNTTTSIWAPAISAPINLFFTNTTHTGTTINWTNTSPTYVTGNTIQRFNGSIWIDIGTVSNVTTSFNITGLTPDTLYTFRVEARSAFYEAPSISATVQTLKFPPSFCTLPDGFTTTDTTCGNTGTITINDLNYFDYFNFTLIDYIGNQYYFATGTTGSADVPSGYYKLSVQAKSQYQYYYGTETCNFNWISIEDTDTTLTLTMVIRDNIITFLLTPEANGRIVGQFTDSVSGLTHNYYIFKSNGDMVLQVTGSTDPMEFVYLPAANGFYYAYVENANGCKALSGIFEVKNDNSPFNLSGVKRVFLSEYKSDLDWIQWSTGDEDYFVAGIDVLKFQSAKIKSFTNANAWYSIPTAEDSSYGQKMAKVRQGFVFNDVLSLSFTPSTYNKWLATGTLLDNRWVIVFEDNNSTRKTFFLGIRLSERRCKGQSVSKTI